MPLGIVGIHIVAVFIVRKVPDIAGSGSGQIYVGKAGIEFFLAGIAHNDRTGPPVLHESGIQVQVVAQQAGAEVDQAGLGQVQGIPGVQPTALHHDDDTIVDTDDVVHAVVGEGAQAALALNDKGAAVPIF